MVAFGLQHSPGPPTVAVCGSSAVRALRDRVPARPQPAAQSRSGGHINRVDPRHSYCRLRLPRRAGRTASGFSFGPMTALR